MKLPNGESGQTREAPPRAEYTRRLEERKTQDARLTRRYRRLVIARNIVLGVIVALAILAEKERVLPRLVLLGTPALLFEGLLHWRNQVGRARRRAALGAEFYGQRLACLDGRWAGSGEPGTRFLDEKHPYALDLDLFGSGGLFELLCTTCTRKGEDTLGAWLRSPATPEVVRRRQQAVVELRPRLDLREDLAVLGAELSSALDLEALAEWGKATPAPLSRWAHLSAMPLAVLGVAALVGWAAFGAGPAPLLLVLSMEGVLAFSLRLSVRKVLAPIERSADDLALFARLLEQVERESVASPKTCRLGEAPETGRPTPSDQMARLARLINRLKFAPIGFLVLWTTQLAFAIETWRRACGASVAHWLDSAAEFEALCALAGYAFDNPADPFPEIISEGPRFEATGLGHPLIPREQCVPNDVYLCGQMRLLVVSGSNMSGKSTLLRSVGVNAVLALAGAPVRAKRLSISPLIVGATLRVQDSLQAGRSRFYAEITRLRQIVDLANGPLPLLFLLDELLHGTNSHDRRLGAEGVLRGLVDTGAIGIITTHDLALTQIADLLAPLAANVHFEDRMENGAITFDYRMRPGVVQGSNALALMRALGLRV